MKVAKASLALLLLFALASCSVHRPEMASRAQRELVGISKNNLLACAGEPWHQERIKDVDFLIFTAAGDNAGTGTAKSASPSIMFGAYRAAQHDCEATFILKDDIVQKVIYQGRTEGLLTKGEKCASIVENCLNR